ncbi:MAG: 1,2-alpha-glucosylglycerol phosphorylase [Fusobacteriaceae bacterium]|jgi:kojibiose phosphorylase|nr:kojP [Fusobacteriales bacterium]MDN5303337.1 1,2-alpha-glucosylglycerol phosphorylase [Fusobacteriaceae bacterium]
MKIKENLFTSNGWDIIEDKYDRKQSINSGSNFMIGNGYLGYRGTFAEEGKNEYAACVVTDTWDKADGKWEELSTVPNALFTKLFINDEEISLDKTINSFERKLDIKHGISSRKANLTLDNGVSLFINEEKFASLNNLHLIPMKYKFSSNQNVKVKIITGIDSDIWSLNGQHLKNHSYENIDDMLFVRANTVVNNDNVVVGERLITNLKNYTILNKEEKYFRVFEFNLEANKEIILEKFMCVYTSNDNENFYLNTKNDLINVKSYNNELEKHKIHWEKLWNLYDIKIDGEITDQVALRFNIYHAIIATPTHKSLPIGARGLSCQAYQGAAFWDQEIYNMPMYLYSNPKVARNILKYRYNTLDGARKKAKKLGFEGAYYAWISGKTGEELCPDFFFKDVLTGRDIRNHFNDWQIHISPDIAYAINRYYSVTNDLDFLIKYGAEIIFEIARFLASRVVYKPVKKRYELIRVQGPDEYHENVDNNAFTNYQTKFALDFALNLQTIIDKENLKKIKEKINLKNEEIELWQDIYNKIYLPTPNKNNLIEQFDGYFNLEDIVPASKVTERLKHKEEYYGWPNGITVFTQCIKQADLIQLFCLYPNLFSKNIIKANYEYYEPRTLHFSSLSPSSYSIVAANLGIIDEAYSKFKKSINIDLLNTNEAISGGTFIGGIHTAACGAAWQMVVFGFAGVSFENNVLQIKPNLPKKWNSVEFYLYLKENHLKIKIEKNRVIITPLKNIKTNIELKINNSLHLITHTFEINY